jgi:hypothetical protein
MAWGLLTSYGPIPQEEVEESDLPLSRSHRHYNGLNTCAWVLIVQCLNLAVISAILWFTLRTPHQALSLVNDSCESLFDTGSINTHRD